MPRHRAVFRLCLCILPVFSVAAQKPPPLRRFEVRRASSEITIDGRLVERAWKDATLIDLPYEWFPGENVKPPVETECLVTYDEANLYLAFKAYDPEPENIRAHLMDRDQVLTLIQDDYVGFMIDTFDDQRRAFQFRINPLGVQAEALNSLNSEDWEWDILWDSAGRIAEEGYTVEVAVPFNQLRFPSSKGPLTFGLSAMRSWPRSVRHRISSSYRDFNDACFFCQYDKVTGFSGVSPGHNVELDPTLTSSRTDARNGLEDASLQKGAVEVEPGLTARWGLTPNLTMTAAVNPDFSQVEADVAQLEVNERFALFFPEKRPFFLEGVDYFQTPLEAVFTRTVADPEWGAKLSGKLGGSSLGLFLTRDRINNLIFPSNQFSTSESLSQEVTGSVLRYRRDVGRSSSIGALYTGRESSGYHNRLAGVDGAVQLGGADTVVFQWLYSDTEYPGEVARRQAQPLDSFGGGGLVVDYTHFTRNWSWEASYEDLSPELRADSGFIPRVDTRTVETWLSRTWWGDQDDRWVSFRLQPRFSRTEDYQGRLTSQSLDLRGQFQGPWQSSLFFNAGARKEFFNGKTFDLNQAFFLFEIQPTGTAKFTMSSLLGDEIDSFNTQKGRILSLRPGVEVKLGRHVNLNLTHSFQRLDVEGGTLFEENLTEARVFYYHDVRTLARLIVQYRDIDRDRERFPLPVEPGLRKLFLQFLFSYKVNPRTVVFIGYSDNYDGLRGVSLTETRRTFFVKLGYAWTM